MAFLCIQSFYFVLPHFLPQCLLTFNTVCLGGFPLTSQIDLIFISHSIPPSPYFVFILRLHCFWNILRSSCLSPFLPFLCVVFFPILVVQFESPTPPSFTCCDYISYKTFFQIDYIFYLVIFHFRPTCSIIVLPLHNII